MPHATRNTQYAIRNTSAQAFSDLAPLYDAEQEANPLARRTRARSLAVLERAFPPGSRLLELGCGTGAEAIWLAGRGRQIVATDAAPAMIATLEAKLAPGGPAAPLAGQITPLVLPAAAVSNLQASYGLGTFDGAYSSFGPLNCEPALGPVARGLAGLVRPGGRLVLSLLNRFCLWETAWYLLRGQPGLAFRRWGGHAWATVYAAWQTVRIPVWYWTPGAIRRAFAPHFRAVYQQALPVLLPPQYLDGLLPRAPALFRALAGWERRLAAHPPFSALGDHVLLVFTRNFEF